MEGQIPQGLHLRIIRSRRKTLSAKVEGTLLEVKAPLYAPDSVIQEFILAHKKWIIKQMARQSASERAAEEAGMLSKEDIHRLARKAMTVIPAKVRHYADLMGVTYGRITIRNQKTRWGSCSAKGNLNFNCLLMLTPDEVIDSVVVHELAHRKEMNHSPEFYAEILKVFPEYRKWDRWLKENGPAIMKRTGR